MPKDVLPSSPVLINAKAGKIQELEQQVEKLLATNLEKVHSPYPFLSQGWQQAKLQETIKKIEETILELQRKIPLDIISEDLKFILRLIQELSGKDYHSDLLEIIFSKFCLGK